MSAPSSPVPLSRPSPSRHSIRSTSETFSLSSSITSDRPISPDPSPRLGEQRPRLLTRPSSSVFLGGGGGSTGPGSGAAGDGTIRLPGFTTAVGLGSPGLFRNPRKSSADFGNTVSEHAAESEAEEEHEEDQPSLVSDPDARDIASEEAPSEESENGTASGLQASLPLAASPDRHLSPELGVKSSPPTLRSPDPESNARDGPSSAASPSPRSSPLAPSPAMQEVSTPQRPSRRTGDRLSAEAPSAEDQDVTPKRTVFRRDEDDDLDALIRDAEEKIKLASTGRRRAGPTSVRQAESIENLSGRASPAPLRTGLRRYESTQGLDKRAQSNAEHDEMESTGEPTLKRSATLSAALGRQSGQGQRRIEADRDDEDRNGANDRSRNRNGNGGMAAPRRRPLPTDFFNPSDHGSTSGQMSKEHQPIATTSRFATQSRLSHYADETLSVNHDGGREAGLRRATSVSRRDPSGYNSTGLRSNAPEQSSTRLTGSQSIRSNMSSLDHRGLPLPPSRNSAQMRAESAIGTNHDRLRYTSIRDETTPWRSTSHALGPSDSVSVVGMQTSRAGATADLATNSKDPLEVLRRLEERREMHNRQWQEDRAASVIGDYASPSRFSSVGRAAAPDRYVRPSTSMSNVRESFRAPPSTAPVDRTRRAGYLSPEAYHQQSPSARPASRYGNRVPATEPRAMRSASSLAGPRPSSTSALHGIASATEHGRLLFEACRALELKLPPEHLHGSHELLQTFESSTRSAENVNATLRNVLRNMSDLCIQSELHDNSGQSALSAELLRLMQLVKEASRASDQSVRDLTRIMLDLPKLLRDVGRTQSPLKLVHSPSLSSMADPVHAIRRTESVSARVSRRASLQAPASDSPRRWKATPSPQDHLNGHFSRYTHPPDSSPLVERAYRHSTEISLRPTTSSLLESPTSTFSSRLKTPSHALIEHERDTNSTPDGPRSRPLSSFMDRVRAYTPRSGTSSVERIDKMGTIDASPPSHPSSRAVSSSFQEPSTLLQAGPADSGSPAQPGHQSPVTAEAVERRRSLKKKASTTSTHTLKGGSSPFHPTSVRRTTTSVSVVNAGASSGSPPLSPISRYSLRAESASQYGGGDGPLHGRASQRSSLDFGRPPQLANIHEPGRAAADSWSASDIGASQGLGDANDFDAVAVLEQRLLQTQLARDDPKRAAKSSKDSQTSVRSSGSYFFGGAPNVDAARTNGSEVAGEADSPSTARPKSLSERVRATLGRAK